MTIFAYLSHVACRPQPRHMPQPETKTKTSQFMGWNSATDPHKYYQLTPIFMESLIYVRHNDEHIPNAGVG